MQDDLDVSELGIGFRGELIQPGDPNYDRYDALSHESGAGGRHRLGCV